MNKKTLIQVVVLLLLVAAAGGAFFLQQEGGLDSLMSYFEDKPEAKKAEIAAPAVKPKPAEPVIPAHPAKGQVAGKDFVVDGASVEAGTLALRQGRAVEVRISGLTKNWEAPAGKKFKFINAAGANQPVVTVLRQDEGQPPVRQEVTGKYTLLLEFGAEQNNKLPGKLLLTLPEAAKGTVGGTFEADITGFRLVNGKPDLGADSIETLQFLVLRELLKDDPDKPLNDTVLRDMRYTVGEGKQVPTGYLEANYRVGEGLPVIQRYQFVKDKSEWRVLRTLRMDQIDEAHPFKAPTPRDKPETLFPHLAAKKLEADTQKKYPKKAIFVSEFTTRYSLKHKVGECAVQYRLESNEQPIRASYLLRDKGKGWTLERELGKKEKLNIDTGKIDKSA